MEAIKPRQIINDAGIVLIDLHQLNVKQLQTIQINDTEYEATSCRRTEPAEQQPQHPLSNQMIEQINIALEQKRSGNFSAWVIEACRRRLTSEKRAYTSIKEVVEGHPVLPSEQDDIVNSLNYEGIAVIELQFYHFPDWYVLALSQTK